MASEPSPKLLFFSAAVEGEFCAWGGQTNNNASLDSYNPVKERWTLSLDKGSRGSPPPCLYAGACALSGHHLYLYGGCDEKCWQCSLHRLDMKTLTWRLLSNGPARKEGCEMVAYENKLILFGGRTYDLPVPAQWDSMFTNELLTFDMEEGAWSSPPVRGTRPPPCCYFSLTKFDEEHAVLFGGLLSSLKKSNDVYVLELRTMEWNKLDCHGPCPVGRSHHAAVCLGYNGKHPLLFVTGGQEQKKVLNDCWMLDIQSGSWMEVRVPGFQARNRHRAAAFSIAPALTLVTIFGGVNSKGHTIANTTVLEFESIGGREWELTDVADNTKLGSPERVRAKEARIQASYIAAALKSCEEADRRVQVAERRAHEAERRAQLAEAQLRGREKEEHVAENKDLDISTLTLLKWTDKDGAQQQLKIIQSIGSKWRKVARLFFKMHTDQIDALERQSTMNAEESCAHVFDMWISDGGQPPVYPLSWSGLHELLLNIDRKILAQDLKTALSTFGVNLP